MAAVAADDDRVDDPVALGQARSEEVGGHPFAETEDRAGSLVAHGPPAGRDGDPLRIPAPHVEIRAADGRLRDLDHHRAGPRVGDGVLTDLEGFALGRKPGQPSLRQAFLPPQAWNPPNPGGRRRVLASRNSWSPSG